MQMVVLENLDDYNETIKDLNLIQGMGKFSCTRKLQKRLVYLKTDLKGEKLE